VKDFRFERSLMQQHFNRLFRNKKISKAVLRQYIEIRLSKISSFQTTYIIEGIITIHGESRK
jgi:hypothetical protein